MNNLPTVIVDTPQTVRVRLTSPASLRRLRVVSKAASVAVGFTARTLRFVLFLVLYWLRLPVMLVSKVISVPMLFAFFFSMYAFPEHRVMTVTFGVMSFAAFVGLFLYDSLLMWLAPSETVRVL